MAHDALEAHARDELGLSEITQARPIQAATSSAASFTLSATVPLLSVLPSPEAYLLPIVGTVSLAFLALTGAVASRVGGAKWARGAGRVLFWRAAAMSITAGVGALFGVAA